jgi:hypothetical protein
MTCLAGWQWQRQMACSFRCRGARIIRIPARVFIARLLHDLFSAGFAENFKTCGIVAWEFKPLPRYPLCKWTERIMKKIDNVFSG